MNFSRLIEMPFSRLVKKILGYDEIYAMAIRKGYPGMLIDGRKDFFSIIREKNDHWYADPILYSFCGKTYLFAEAYSRTIFRGHIVVMEIFDDMSHTEVVDVIKEPYHMSFPMVFSWNDNMYMLPEASENRSINLYKATSFPYKWELVKQFVVKEQYVDTIVLKKYPTKIECLTSIVFEGNPLLVKYQKFFIIIEGGDIKIKWDDEYNDLSSFNLDDRNAGPIINGEHKNYIPTQSSSELDYGVKLNFREIDDTEPQVVVNQLTKDNVTIKGINSNNIIGIHTYSCTDAFEVIDVRYTVFSPFYQWKKILRL